MSALPKGTWLEAWEPENKEFWESTGKKLAVRTLALTTVNLMLAFVVWFVVSALVVRLPQIGFQLDTAQLFWLTAMPGLAGGALRLVHMFLTPLFGTRMVVSVSTFSLLIPAVGWFFALQDPSTPFWVLLLLSFLAGLGGGNFSSFMPSTSLFFPKRLQGTALAVQAGVGNFGVSLVQFVTPWIIGFALAGGTFLGGSQTLTGPGGAVKQVWLQNALTIYIPLLAVFSATAWILLKSVPIKANFKEQFDIFRRGNTWAMTSLYMMTFGAFSGLAGTFPLLIKQTYGGLEGAPDPLTFAFLGPLVGSLFRVAAGPLTDKFGGAKITTLAGAGMTLSALAVTLFTKPTSMDQFPWFLTSMLALFFFSGVGNASTFKQMPMLFQPRQAAGVIGFTAAVAAFGPFLFGMLFGAAINLTGSPDGVFYGLGVFFLFNTVLNWSLYSRKNAPHPC